MTYDFVLQLAQKREECPHGFSKRLAPWKAEALPKGAVLLDTDAQKITGLQRGPQVGQIDLLFKKTK